MSPRLPPAFYLSYDERLADLVSRYPRLTRNSAMMLLVLSDAKGRVVASVRIIEEIEEMWGRDSEEMSLASAAKALRKAVGEYGIGVKSSYGIGMRLTGYEVFKEHEKEWLNSGMKTIIQEELI